MKVLVILTLASLGLVIMGTFVKFTNVFVTEKSVLSMTKSHTDQTNFKMLKDVGEAYMDHFGLTDKDFKLMQAAGITHIEGNFDICALDEDVTYFLDQADKHNIQVIMPAGAGEAEWGYSCDKESFPKNQKPVWQTKLVKSWVTQWKNHPAVYAWDTSNEAGSVLPNARWQNDKNSTIPESYYLTVDQLQTAYLDVKSIDPKHPVLIRMNGWFFYDFEDNFFRAGNPFRKGIADIVMVNAYSNVEDYYDDFVKTVMTRAVSSIYLIDKDVKFIVSLGVWEEPPLWFLPSTEHLENDIAQIDHMKWPVHISFFKYGAAGSEWYLPKDAKPLWQIISNLH